jgi:hypothetical protein
MVAPGTLPNLPEFTAEQAERWIEAALAEAKALRQHDDQLFPSSDDPTALYTARQLHDAWQRWVEGAEDLQRRILPLISTRRHIAGAHDLEYAIGRTLAMLQVTPEGHLNALERIRRDETVSSEEVRRELQRRIRP